MLDQLVGLVERAELAVASSSGVVSDDALESLIGILRAIRIRMSYPEDTLVVALAGGTGSGKSSLFNVLVGADLVDVGGVRPTTSQPEAALPVGVGHGLDGFLDHIGVTDRHEHGGPPMCFVDLPDTDSVEVEHRHRVDSILPFVDVVIWVTDPEKYRDARLHHDYLAPLSDYAAQFVVVLNQIDRLDQAAVEDVVADLRSALDEDGLARSWLLPVAAAPVAGPPIGIDVLIDTLRSMSRDTVARKLVTDLAATARALSAGVGNGVDYDRRAGSAVRQAAIRLEGGDVGGAESILTGFLDEVATEVGGPTGRKLSLLAADVPGHLARIASELEAGGRGRGLLPLRRKPAFDRTEAAQKLSESVTRPARAVLAKRAVAVASIVDLAVEIESLRTQAPG